MPKTPFIQTSFRISEKTQQQIREMAEAKNTSQSDIMRAAVALYNIVNTLEPSLKLAVVDITDKKNDEWFRVKQWIIESE